MSDQVELYLALAREGIREPASAADAGPELYRAALRVRGLKPRSPTLVVEALRQVVEAWPEAVRPSLAEMAKIAAFVTAAPVKLPAAESAAPRRKAVGGDGDQAPPTGIGDDGDVPVAAAEYTSVVRAWARFLDSYQPQGCVVPGVRPDANCGWLSADDRRIEVSTGDMVQTFQHQHQLRHAPIKDNHLATCVGATLADLRRRRRAEVVERMTGTPVTAEGAAALDRLVEVLTGKADSLARAVLAQFLWQVKRRACGLGIKWDLMPVLVGPQGGGKSTVVSKLCECWAELQVPVTAQQIVQPQEAPVMAMALVAIWDEMSGASKADADAIKRGVSLTTAAWRRMYSQDYEVRRRTVTFIGTTNFSLSTILTDTSGARRFAEVATRFLDRDAVNAIDFRLVWDAVSELDEVAPVEPVMGLLQEHWKTLVPHDLMAEWMDHEARTGFEARKIFVADGDIIIVPPLDPPPPTPDGDSLPGGWTLTDIERRVGSFAASLRQGTPTQARITQRLRELGWHHRRERIGPRRLNQRTWKWFLDPVVRQSLTAGDPDVVDASATDSQQEAAHGPF